MATFLSICSPKPDTPFGMVYPSNRYIQAKLLALGFLVIQVFSPAVAAAGVRGTHSTHLQYVVSDEAPTLCEIGLVLYSRCSAFREIARWNGIPEPYIVHPGQRLILKKPPANSREEGQAKLRDAWRRHFSLPAVEVVSPRETVRTEREEKELWKQAEQTVVPDVPVAVAAEPGSTETVVIEAPAPEALPPESPAVTPGEPAPPVPETKPLPIVVPIQALEPKSTRELFEQGQKLFSESQFEEALLKFQACRKQDSAFLPAAISELRALQALSRNREACLLAREVLSAHPELEALPLITQAQAEGCEP